MLHYWPRCQWQLMGFVLAQYKTYARYLVNVSMENFQITRSTKQSPSEHIK
jgi:hypothetical protein